MRVCLQIAAIFIAVGLGALTVTLLHDPTALIPHPPYGRWLIVRLMLLSSLAVLGLLLVFGVVDDRTDLDDTDGALASATFVAVSAFVDYLDGAAAAVR